MAGLCAAFKCCIPAAKPSRPVEEIFVDPVAERLSVGMVEKAVEVYASNPILDNANDNVDTGEKGQKADSPPIDPAVVATMVPDQLLDSMKRWTNNAVAVEACLKQLRVLCRDDDACAVSDGLGCFAEIAALMTKHHAVDTLQIQACAVLINLCAGDSYERRNRAAEVGALDCVLAAMKTHPNSPHVQEMAFVAVQNICFGQDAAGADRRKLAVDVGAIEQVVAAMNKHIEQQSLVDQGSSTLRLLANKNKQYQQKAISAGAKKEWVKMPSGGLIGMGGKTGRMRNKKGH